MRSCMSSVVFTARVLPPDSPLENLFDVGQELDEEEVDRVADEGVGEALEGGVGADAVVAGRAALPEVRERGGRERAGPARDGRLEFAVVAALDEIGRASYRE